MEGKFIVFEGISGSCKGTQARRTVQYLQEKDEYNNILITPEPTRSEYGLKVRALMREHRDHKENPENHAREYLDCFLKDRIDHQKLIDENLRQGVHVLGVRYYHSTLVHQQSPTITVEEIILRHQEAGIRHPDLTIILDVLPNRALGRITNRDEKGVYETLGRLGESRDRYLQLPAQLPDKNIVTVFGQCSIDDTFQEYKPFLDQLFKVT